MYVRSMAPMRGAHLLVREQVRAAYAARHAEAPNKRFCAL